ncbi:glycogen debranching N-terminal domain-containing protein [Streptomyces sp. NPDC007088]|uniref:glycogen debranching N-terminal domain-containing protein n=1 Tax=Streptomyces sp. NPDC007088 TaxID=3364773 RepID=UPI00368E6AD6
MMCVALPALAVSAPHGQLTGEGLDGFYLAGRRLLSRCRLRVAGREPLPVQARMEGSDRARFLGVLRSSGGQGPDPDLVVERLRRAVGVERITLRSSAAHPVRVLVEISLGTDLADLGTVAAGRSVPEVPAAVHGTGLRWSSPQGPVAITAAPPAEDAVAAVGLLRWHLEIPAGGSRTVELRLRQERPGGVGPARASGGAVLSEATATGDDPRARALLAAATADLRALLLRDPAHPAHIHLAAGAPWRCGLAPADALAAARMALPLGTTLAHGTLRTLARTQFATGPRRGSLPGPPRDAGPHLPPGSTGVEATLLFPALLAEARRWGLGEREVTELLPAAEGCLAWLRRETRADPFLRDRETGGAARVETQAHAYRAALLGADLLEAFDRPGAAELRSWAADFGPLFRRSFWTEDRGGGRPAAALLADDRPVPHLGGAAAHLLDTGLLGAGRPAPGLLDRVQTGQLARLLGGPAMDSGWGLRSLAAGMPRYNPFGHRGGAVRVHETAVAVAGLAAAGHEKEAHGLLRGLLSAAESFDYRMPEMFAGEQRTEGAQPWPHPAACRPAALPAAAAVHLLVALTGLRPDVPARSVTLRPTRGAPLGELGLTGLVVAERAFAVRVSRLGVAMVEEASPALQLGA